LYLAVTGGFRVACTYRQYPHMNFATAFIIEHTAVKVVLNGCWD